MKRFTAMLLLTVMVLAALCGCAVPSEKTTSAQTAELSGDITDEPLTPELTDPPTTPEQTDYEGPDKKTVVLSSRRKFMYKNMYFYSFNDHEGGRINGQIRYQIIEEPVEGGLSVFSDTTEYSESFFGKNKVGGVQQMAVDVAATEKNGGVPVLIFAAKLDSSSKYSLMSFNMATNEGVVILRDVESEDFTDFCIYGDTIYYFVTASKTHVKKITTVNSIKTDGSGHRKYDKEFVNIIPTITFYKNRAYYYTNLSSDPTIYVTDLNFEKHEKLMSVKYIVPNIKIRDGYVYYADDKRNTMAEEQSVAVYNIYRRSLENFENSTPELLAEDARNYYLAGSKVVYYHKDDMCYVEGLASWYFTPFVLRVYDLNTEESKTLISGSPQPETLINIMEMNKNSEYLLFMTGTNTDPDTNEYLFVNVDTGKLYKFPYYPFDR